MFNIDYISLQRKEPPTVSAISFKELIFQNQAQIEKEFLETFKLQTQIESRYIQQTSLDVIGKQGAFSFKLVFKNNIAGKIFFF